MSYISTYPAYRLGSGGYFGSDLTYSTSSGNSDEFKRILEIAFHCPSDSSFFNVESFNMSYFLNTHDVTAFGKTTDVKYKEGANVLVGRDNPNNAMFCDIYENNNTNATLASIKNNHVSSVNAIKLGGHVSTYTTVKDADWYGYFYGTVCEIEL